MGKADKQSLDATVKSLRAKSVDQTVEMEKLKTSELNFLADIKVLKADKQSLDTTVKSLRAKSVDQSVEMEKLKTFELGEKTKLKEELENLKQSFQSLKMNQSLKVFVSESSL